MLTEKRMQKVLDKVIGDIELKTDILDSHGVVVASSDRARVGISQGIVRSFALDDDDDDKEFFIDGSKTYMKFLVDKTLAYYLSMEGTGQVTRNYCLLMVSLLEVYIKSMLQKVDKDGIIRRLLLDQLSELEVQELVRDYKLDPGIPRCVYVLKTMGVEADTVYQILIKAFPRNQGDIIVLMDGMTVVLIKAITEEMDDEELVQLADAIEESIMNEATIKAYIGIGTIKDSIYTLKESFNEASAAIEVGKVYSSSSRVYFYEFLLLERFLFEVPPELCEIFGKSLFTQAYKKLLSDEMIATIEKFFENSLNLSETSRQLFIHRNTLVYRLDKIQKVMGLDLRNFHDAVTFKIMRMLMERYIREC